MTDSTVKEIGKNLLVMEDASVRGLGIRHVQVAVMATAAFIAYLLRTILSIAIVAMVDKHDSNSTEPLAQTFDWNEETQGYVLSSFFWGYLLTQIPAGVLTERFGGNRFLCSAILASSILSIALPQCAYIGGWMLVCANRMLQGMCQGFVFPSIFTLLGVWAPPAERSRFSSFAVSAQLLGTVTATPFSGFLSSAYGWPSVFYTFGGLGTGLGVAMIFLGADSPSTSRLISYSEKQYIVMSLGGAKEKLGVPWSGVLTSVPYYAAVFIMALHSAVYLTFITEIPTYLGTVLKFSMQSNGLLSALPYLTAWLLTFVCSWACDFMVNHGWLKITPARKVFSSIAHFGGATFLVLLGFSRNKVLSVALLTLTVGSQAGVIVAQAGFVDLSPNFSGAIFSVANFVSACFGVLGPIVVGHIVTETGSIEQWQTVFFLSAALYVLSNVVYLIWGTSETQWWNWPDKYSSNQNYIEALKRDEKPHVATAPRLSVTSLA